jgi:spore germination protein GerM
MAKKAKSSLGITFWVALLVFLGLLYTANRVDLSSIIGGSGSSEIVQLFGGDYSSKSDDAPAEKPAAPALPAETRVEIKETKQPVTAPARETPTPPKPAAQTRPAEPPAVKQTAAPKTESAGKPAAAEKAPEVSAKPEPSAKPAEPARKTRESVLYFIRLSDAGEITLAKTPREIHTADAPLTDTLRALAAGPTEKESKTGCTSLIPAESKLLSVAVRDGIAFVNFDENFRFNAFGREGYNGQVKQLVYTATEFPTIQAVQILINGSKIDYLGSEGIYIGRPVGKKDI